MQAARQGGDGRWWTDNDDSGTLGPGSSEQGRGVEYESGSGCERGGVIGDCRRGRGVVYTIWIAGEVGSRYISCGPPR